MVFKNFSGARCGGHFLLPGIRSVQLKADAADDHGDDGDPWATVFSLFLSPICAAARRIFPLTASALGKPRMASDFVAAYRNGGYISNYARDFIEIARRVGNTVSESGE